MSPLLSSAPLIRVVFLYWLENTPRSSMGDTSRADEERSIKDEVSDPRNVPDRVYRYDDSTGLYQLWQCVKTGAKQNGEGQVRYKLVGGGFRGPNERETWWGYGHHRTFHGGWRKILDKKQTVADTVACIGTQSAAAQAAEVLQFAKKVMAQESAAGF